MPGNQTKESDKKAPPEKGSAQAPAIQLPKGGGTIRGMGEKFGANPVTGTGSMTVPIATSPGRSGFGPQLSLSYDSGAGNGPFGFGWSLSIPSITRKTDKGLPKYQDTEESDVFILSGAEDLVPVLEKNNNGQWVREIVPPRTVDGKTYKIQHYRPRVEGLFARIERWTNDADLKDTFWRSISKDNITTWYGKTAESRIADPADISRIFSWLICQSYDDKGNAIVYEYAAENDDNVVQSLANERNRVRTANRYLKHIKYGNRMPRQKNEDLATHTDWLFEVVFDYGEHDLNTPRPEEPGKKWPVRNDPFSSYRAGFEVRTYRLCQRVLMFHHFPGEKGVGQNCLVRSTDFTYSYETDLTSARNPIFSFLLSVTQTGYKRKGGGGYLSKSLPPLEFEYTQPIVDEMIREVGSESLENLPYGLDGSNYHLMDLDGEGLSGILTEQADGWFYKRNLSANHYATDPDTNQQRTVARFSPVELVAANPNATLTAGHAQFMDLAGDGQADLVEMEGPVRGFYERTQDEDWEPFQPFVSWPNVDTRDPNLKFIDLTGDGHADILISEDQAFVWHASLAEAGFETARRVQKVFDEEKGPRLVFADSEQTIYLADMSGDGLTDLVRIRNGDVCYWPNLGYGCFGAKVTMDNVPWFDSPDLFDQRRIRLADVDGSGVTDILYLGRKGVHIYFNQSGNSWSEPRLLAHFPPIDNLASIQALDLLGNGTACLLWSSPLPGNVRRPMRYIALMGGQKPHLLVRTRNNLGAETRVSYVASTKFYLDDKLAGKPWVTKLPFPVHVVERVETYDHISRNRFITRYAYHHGYFDGIEREFRGFGMVEQRDTEEFAALSDSDSLAPLAGEGGGEGASNIDAFSHVPPVLTKTWFHTGAYYNGQEISKHFEQEYYREGDPSLGESGLSDDQLDAMLLEDTILPEILPPEGTREAARALKGSILRVEIYALDEKEESDRPYTVSERSYQVRQLQPRAENRHAVFLVHPRETIDFHYERKLYDISGEKHADPRVTHTLTLQVDEYGNVLKSATIGYGRRYRDSELTEDDRKKQEQTLLTYTDNSYTNPILAADNYRTPLPCESRTYELVNIEPGSTLPGVTNLFWFDELKSKIEIARDLNYEDVNHLGAVDDNPWRRLIERIRTLYRKNDLTALLSPGVLESLALPGESYKLAFTPGLLNQVYQHNGQPLLPDPAIVLSGQGQDRGGYVDLDGDDHWWIPSGKAFYHPDADIADPTSTAAQELAEVKQHFFLPRKYLARPLAATKSEIRISKYETISNNKKLNAPNFT